MFPVDNRLDFFGQILRNVAKPSFEDRHNVLVSCLASRLASLLGEQFPVFFRTPEGGAWTIDPTQRDDESTLNLIRGNWDASDLPSIGGVYRVPGYARWVSQHGYLANTVPMLLSVTVAESEEGLQIHLRHTAWTREPEIELRDICETAVDAELKSLAKYLKQAFHLSSVPEVTMQPSADPACVV